MLASGRDDGKFSICDRRMLMSSDKASTLAVSSDDHQITDDPDAVDVNHADMACLAPEAYLSSTIYQEFLYPGLKQSNKILGSVGTARTLKFGDSEDGINDMIMELLRREKNAGIRPDMIMELLRRENNAGIRPELLSHSLLLWVFTVQKEKNVAEFLQEVPHLYCIGDANGKMMLAHAASAQGISGWPSSIACFVCASNHGFRIDSESLNKVSVLVVLDLSKKSFCDLIESLSPQVVAATKLHIFNPNEFDMWKMRIEQYFLMTDYSLWEVILNGDSPIPTRIVDGVVQVIATTTAEQRFGGNKETKKVQKTLLKQQYENFSGTSSKSLDQIHDRLQKLISQLEILGESISQEDINLKFLRSLLSEWKTHTLIWRNKADLEEQSLDDLLNNLKIYEAEVNINTVPSVSAASYQALFSTLLNVDSLSDALIYSFFASRYNSPRRFLQKTERNLGANRKASIAFDMSKVECYNFHRRGHFSRDFRSPRDNKNKDTPRRTIPVEVSTLNALLSQCDAVGSYDWSFQADEEPTNYALMAYASSGSSSSPGSENEVAPCSKACSKAYATLQSHYDKLTINFRKSQIDVLLYKTSLELVEASQVFNRRVFDYDELNSSESDDSVPTSLVHDRYKSGKGYHAVPPPYTGPFMPPKPDLVFNNVPPASETVLNVTSDFEDEYEHESVSKHKEPSCVPTFKHVKTPRASVKIVEHPKQADNLRTDDQKSRGYQGKLGVETKMYCGNPYQALKDKGVIDSGCSRYMTGNISYLSDYEEFNRGYVAFGGNPKGGKISGKGKIKTGKLDFDDVYFVKELKFNLFSVSQMCDKKNNVFFIDTECVVLSSDFKMPHDNHVLLRVQRENNMYNVDLKNVVPLGNLTCLFAKATLDESNLWHRWLGQINFKTMNKHVKGNLVRGLPSKIFENNHICVACKKGKQHRASFMSSASSAITYTSVYTDSEPWRFYGGSDEEPADAGPPRVIVYGYDRLHMHLVASPSPDYMPGPEHPPSPDYVPGPEHPPSLVYVPKPEYPEYLVPSGDETPIEDQPLHADASPTALSPGYVADFDPDEDPEEDHADYPADGWDGDDEPFDDEDGDDDDTDDKDEEASEDEDDDEEKEEGHLAPADSSTVSIVDHVPSAGDTEALRTDESAPTPRAPQTQARIAEHVVAPVPPLLVSSSPLPLPLPLSTNGPSFPPGNPSFKSLNTNNLQEQ
nr:ribonuclease H-like domain-containing protein [Tanacetum cinerariifolium]